MTFPEQFQYTKTMGDITGFGASLYDPKTDALMDMYSEAMIKIEHETGDSLFSVTEIERIFERKFDDRIEIRIRTKSGDVISTNYKTLLEAQECLLLILKN